MIRIIRIAQVHDPIAQRALGVYLPAFAPLRTVPRPQRRNSHWYTLSLRQAEAALATTLHTTVMSQGRTRFFDDRDRRHVLHQMHKWYTEGHHVTAMLGHLVHSNAAVRVLIADDALLPRGDAHPFVTLTTTVTTTIRAHQPTPVDAIYLVLYLTTSALWVALDGHGEVLDLG